MSMPWFEKVCFPRYTFSLFSWLCSSEAGRLYVSWVCRRNQLWINTNTSSESTRRRGLELFWFYLSLLLLFLKIKFLGGVAMFMVDSSYRNHSLRWKLLTRAINVKKLAIVYSTIPVWFGDRGGGGWGVGTAKGKIFTTPPLPLSLFLTGDRPLGTNFFLTPAFCWHLKKTWRPQFLVRKYWVLARQNCACCAGYWNHAYFLLHVQSAKSAFRAYFKVCYSCYEY